MTDHSMKSTADQISNCAIIAVNHIDITYDRFKEAAKDIMNRKYNKIMSKVALLLAALLGILLLIGYMMKTDSKILLVELIMYIPLLIIIRFYLPDIELKRGWNIMTQATDGNDPVRDVYFTPLSIVVKPQQGTESTYQYMDVVSIRKTEHLIILSLANKSEILLDKDGFTSGSFEEISHLFSHKEIHQ